MNECASLHPDEDASEEEQEEEEVHIYFLNVPSLFFKTKGEKREKMPDSTLYPSGESTEFVLLKFSVGR